MAKLRLLKTGHGDLTLAEWDKDRPETVARGGIRVRRAFHCRAAWPFVSTDRDARRPSASSRNPRPRS